MPDVYVVLSMSCVEFCKMVSSNKTGVLWIFVTKYNMNGLIFFSELYTDIKTDFLPQIFDIDVSIT